MSSRRTSSKSLMVDAMSAFDPAADLLPLLFSIQLLLCTEAKLPHHSAAQQLRDALIAWRSHTSTVNMQV